MASALPPPQLPEATLCAIAAAVKFEVPVNAMLAVVENEGGRPGQWVLNANGTHDVGSMQFNTAYVKTLARYGIKIEDVAASGCYPFELAAWRIRMHVRQDAGEFWSKVANYHSRTPKYNERYRAGLLMRATRWAAWLRARFPTREWTPPDASEQPPASSLASSSVAPRVAARTFVARSVTARVASSDGERQR